MPNELVLIAPSCTCCAVPQPLIPRTDLAPELAACPQRGTLYRQAGSKVLPATMPDLGGVYQPMPNVRIDLSQAGYA